LIQTRAERRVRLSCLEGAEKRRRRRMKTRRMSERRERSATRASSARPAGSEHRRGPGTTRRAASSARAVLVTFDAPKVTRSSTRSVRRNGLDLPARDANRTTPSSRSCLHRWRRNRALASIVFGSAVQRPRRLASMPDHCRWLRSVGPQRALLQRAMVAVLQAAALSADPTEASDPAS
jgi:hypothetical protein